ncbi:hypothetical protein HOR30_gp13 [Klebsiella phage KP-Rio/2015]|uniref:Uncharacterized protein n=1 Tax=Klebsiella phage KP-Rio/2015 TaxID=1904925 RepID=A0A1D8ES43_9CAUD|nr:hypothetical protein HOR30_gp13 [Klebsiella phage KP-Rio/2015]AOT23852.1 hypothetical protein KPRIO2015_13 [Klebsiella phage KP-Rio/2015]
MGIWILIMAINGSAVSGTDFAALTTQEFTTQAACNKAAKAFEEKFEEKFDTFRVYTAKAICVPKEV